MIQRISVFLDQRSKPALLALSFAVTILLGALDFLSGSGVHFLVLYLIPIFIGSWFVSKVAGVYLALFAALVWLGVTYLNSPFYLHSWILYWNLLTRVAVFVVFALTQALLRAKFDELSRLVGRDFLTGLPNGQAFYELTAKEMDRAFGVEPMTMAYIDVSGLSWVNHRFGYPTGDQMMCTIAHTIRQHAPRPDLVGRLGGSSFALLLPNVDSDVANLILGRVQGALHEERRRYSYPLTFYISAIACTKAPRTVAELMQEADAQMTRIKGVSKDSLEISRVDNLPVLN